MDLLQTILNAQGGGAVAQLSDRFGLDQGQTVSALEQLVPALLGGARRNAEQGGLEGLLGMLGGANHEMVLDQPETLQAPALTGAGNEILSQLFGSKDVSRGVASEASAATGIGADILKQMLPVVATMVMGGMARQRAQGASPEGILGMLTPMLDANGDGSIADDVLGMAARMFLK